MHFSTTRHLFPVWLKTFSPVEIFHRQWYFSGYSIVAASNEQNQLPIGISHTVHSTRSFHLAFYDSMKHDETIANILGRMYLNLSIAPELARHTVLRHYCLL